jgi:hypothetical protein
MRTPYFLATESSPVRFTIEFNGTKTILVQTRIGDELAWIGRPFSTESDDFCKVSLVIGANGSIPYGPALNFIVDGGNPKRGAVRTKEQYDISRQMLQKAFMHHVTAFYTVEQREADLEELGVDLSTWLHNRGFSVVTGETTEEDMAMYELLGMESELVGILMHHKLVALPFFGKLLAGRVPPSFATIVEGEWDQFSSSIAVTNHLTMGEVAAMKMSGKKFMRTSEVKKSVA